MRTALSALLALIVISVTSPVMAEAAKLELGKKVFTELAEPGCPICHTLADAGAKGEVGPSLDTMKPDFERVETAVSVGVGAMPPYENLTDEQIKAVALYVAEVAGKTE
ncbi:MAG: cytochrome c [Rhodomicrobium sp.]|nr:cytochrome c [Rhodomicrobium sp.]